MGGQELVEYHTFPVENGKIALEFSDRWSLFGRGPSPQEIPGLGAARCSCAVEAFRVVEQYGGARTNFLEKWSNDTLLMDEYILEDGSSYSLPSKTYGRVLPVEWVYHCTISDYLWKKVCRGELSAKMLGFKPGTELRRGLRLPTVYQECHGIGYFRGEVLSCKEVILMTGLDFVEWVDARMMIGSAVGALSTYLGRGGYECLGGRLQLGLTHKKKPVIVGPIGTIDTTSIAHARTKELWGFELIRKHLVGIGWVSELAVAKKRYPNDDSMWPEYPTLPESLIERTGTRCLKVSRDCVFERMCA